MLEPEIAFLPKPYTPTTLACKVREMLDGANAQGLELEVSPSGSRLAGDLPRK
jgi:hypothetical protein